MKREYLLILLIFVAFFTGAIIGSSGAQGYSAEMKAGTYEAYSVHKMFNPHTGEPVYWIVAATLKREEIWTGSNIVAPVNQGDFRFYEVPRARVVNLPNSTDADPGFYFHGEITVQ